MFGRFSSTKNMTDLKISTVREIWRKKMFQILTKKSILSENDKRPLKMVKCNRFLTFCIFVGRKWPKNTEIQNIFRPNGLLKIKILISVIFYPLYSKYSIFEWKVVHQDVNEKTWEIFGLIGSQCMLFGQNLVSATFFGAENIRGLS